MDAEQRDLLLSLAFIYLSCGRERRALPLLLLVVGARPTDADALRALAHTYTATGHGERALAVLDRLEAQGQGDDAIILLRSRALHQLSRLDEAQACFRTLGRRRNASMAGLLADGALPEGISTNQVPA